jgi:hypothetical protein
MNWPSQSSAAEELKLSLPTSPDGVESKFLETLSVEDWYPNSLQSTAFEILSKREILNADHHSSHKKYEMQDLRHFLSNFWTLSPEERSRWSVELKSRCRDRFVLRRLQSLEPGLQLKITEAPRDTELAELAKFLRADFVACTPRERLDGLLRYQASGPTAHSLIGMVQELKSLDPELVKLCHESVRTITTTPKFEWDISVVAEARKLRKKATKETVSSSEVLNQATQWGSLGWIWVAILVLSCAGRFAYKASSPAHVTPQPPFTPSQSYNSEPRDSTIFNPRGGFTKEEVELFTKHYASKSKSREPDRYDAWKKSGMPQQPSARVPSMPFTTSEIKLFRDYDTTSKNNAIQPPVKYSLWMQCGKPLFPHIP